VESEGSETRVADTTDTETDGISPGWILTKQNLLNTTRKCFANIKLFRDAKKCIIHVYNPEKIRNFPD